MLGNAYSSISAIPRFHAEVQLVTPVPSLRRRLPHNLPTVLSRCVGQAIGVRTDTSLVHVVYKMPEMKLVPPEERSQRLRGAFAVDGRLHGSVVVVDDLLQSGSTIAECGRVLREAGAQRVIALAATRATKGMGTWPPRQMAGAL
jgi:predicted amidophosphoribosyltransferase